MNWHGSYLNEDGIVADMLAKIKAEPEGVKLWLDPHSWTMPFIVVGSLVPTDLPPYAGCLMHVGMQVRNYYGLWHASCPYTKCGDLDLEITDGIITDPLFPDNMSARIIERVRKSLGEEKK